MSTLAGLWNEREYLYAVCTSAELNTKLNGGSTAGLLFINLKGSATSPN